jgi:hypothetical protein
VLPKFNVVTIDHFPGVFSCAIVVIVNQIYGFRKMAVTANKAGSIVRHDRHSFMRAISVHH